MNNTIKTVYIPIKEHSEFKILEGGIGLENCYPTEAYVFLPEELKELLEEYTNRIVENAEAKVLGTGDTWAEVVEESITSQLPKFLKENNLI